MKRKIMKIADTTYVVSIPLKWAKKQNIKKGDEVDMQIRGKEIILSLENNKKEKISHSIDINSNERTGQSYITAMYRKGIDEITLKYQNPEYIKKIEKCIAEQTIGLEIIKNTKDSCKIVDFSGDSDNEFENALRRSWLLLIGMSDEILELIEKKDYSQLEMTYIKDRNINKFTNYCLRTLQNKNKQFSSYKSTVLYHFIRNLEEIGDDYNNLSTHIFDSKSFSELQILKEINTILREFYEIFYKYEDSRLESLFEKTKKIKNLIEKNQKNKTSISMYYVLSINSRIRKLLSTLLEVHLANTEE